MRQKTSNLREKLPFIRGRYLFDVPLAPITWFRVGGAAQVTFKPADLEDLSFFLKHSPEDLPLYSMGVGSNVLVRDGGVRGVVIRLGQGFTNIEVKGTSLIVGGGVLDRTIAGVAAEEGISGFEFLCGIPGTLGGAIRMNAGAYGADIAGVLDYAIVVDRAGKIQSLSPQDLGLSYRHSQIPKDWIIVGARLRGKKGRTSEIKQKMLTLLKEREKTQPVKSRTSGSTFANPTGGYAWELIDKAGCRGLSVGGALISDLHCNFMINTGQATAKDLETLGEEVRKKVFAATGVDLRWEIERIGETLGNRMLVEGGIT